MLGNKTQIGNWHLFFVTLIISVILLAWAVTVSEAGSNNQESAPPMPVSVAASDVALTPTPSGPFLQLLPDCGNPPTATFNIVGGNWPDPTVFLYWYNPTTGNDTFIQSVAPISGTFSVNWARSVVTGTTYLVKAASATYPYPGSVIQNPFTTPCSVPPAPVDLQIGQLEMVSTPPIVAYQPVQFRAVVSNTGDFDVNQLFFVDLFIDPGIPVPTGTITIPLGLSDGFTAVSSLANNSQKTITITAQLGFGNTPETHLVYALVDSVEQVSETDETNNVATAVITNITPAATATPSPTPGPGNTIQGIVRVRPVTWQPAYRALVTLINSSGTPIASLYTDNNGFYKFMGVPANTYSIQSCYELDGSYFAAVRSGITPPNPLANLFLVTGACP